MNMSHVTVLNKNIELAVMPISNQLIKIPSAFQDTKTESSVSTIKLSFLVLLCVTEDQYANALMHDPNLVFRVRMHRAPMRHRKV